VTIKHRGVVGDEVMPYENRIRMFNLEGFELSRRQTFDFFFSDTID
jgi:hypothetical protein